MGLLENYKRLKILSMSTIPGTMLAFIAGVAAACPGFTVLTGDESLRKLRKITKNLIAPFSGIGS